VNHVIGKPVAAIAVGDFRLRNARFGFLDDTHAGRRTIDYLQAIDLFSPSPESSFIIFAEAL
jgi:hypothetical protein